MTKTPWGHVSSGCIYTGAKIETPNSKLQTPGKRQTRSSHAETELIVERDLTRPDLRRLFASHPEKFYGFTESDAPNFSFRSPPCSFYSGTKALAEEVLQEYDNCYVWRLRIPFDEFDHPRNFLSKLQHYPRIYNNVNSLSHRGDFVRACLDLWDKRAPFGVYNVTNPGAVTTRCVVEQLQRVLKPARTFDFWKNDSEFYAKGAKAPRSNCILDSSKLLTAGVRMRPVEHALSDALQNWHPTADTLRMLAGVDEPAAPVAALVSVAESAIAQTQHWLRAN
jgi:nucleoside-diphosphate-sugar epimerase